MKRLLLALALIFVSVSAFAQVNNPTPCSSFGTTAGTCAQGSAAAPAAPLGISQLGLSNDGTSPNTVLDVAPGWAEDTTNSVLMVYPGGTVNFAVTGAGGLDTGSIGASSQYGIFEISGSAGTAAIASLESSVALSGNGSTLGATALAASQSLSISSPETVLAGGILSIAGAGPQATTYRGPVASGSSGQTVTVTNAIPTAVTGATFTYEQWSGGGGPIMPSGYTKYRYIGTWITDASSHLLAISQKGRLFTPLALVNTALPSTTAVAMTQLVSCVAAPLPCMPQGKLQFKPAGAAGDGLLMWEISPSGNETAPRLQVIGQITSVLESMDEYGCSLRAFGGYVFSLVSSGSDTNAQWTNDGWCDPNVAP